MSNKTQQGSAIQIRTEGYQWKFLELKDGDTPEGVKLPVGPVLVPLNVWKVRRADLFRREHDHGWPLGVWLKPDEKISLISKDLHDLSLITLNSVESSTSWQYAVVSELRGHYGYTGDIHISKSRSAGAPDTKFETPYFPQPAHQSNHLVHAA